MAIIVCENEYITGCFENQRTSNHVLKLLIDLE